MQQQAFSRNLRAGIVPSKSVACNRSWHAVNSKAIRARGVSCMAATVATGTDGLVLTKGSAGSWDEGGVGSPVHPCVGGLDAVSSASGSLGVAISNDGVNWMRGEDVVNGSRGAEKEADILGSGGASTGSGVFWMFYTGGDFNVTNVPPGLPGFGASATSPSSSTDWDARKGRYIVGVATSEDGFQWKKKGAVFDPVEQIADADKATAFDALGVASRHVQDIENRQYVMYYEAVGVNNVRSLGMAVSKDGLKSWKRCPYPIFSADADSWDSGSVGAPCPVSMSAGNVDGGKMFEGVPSVYKRRTAKSA
eukprot:gene5904-33475_t